MDVDDRGIQSILRDIPNDLLLIALKGADEDLRQKIFNNMSTRAAELLSDDLEVLGPTRLSDVESAQREILNIARQKANDGEIILGGSGEKLI